MLKRARSPDDGARASSTSFQSHFESKRLCLPKRTPLLSPTKRTPLTPKNHYNATAESDPLDRLLHAAAVSGNLKSIEETISADDSTLILNTP